MYLIYHKKDFDGICSAAIIKMSYPDADLIGWDYGDPYDQFLLFIDEDIIVVDIHFPMNTMYNISSRNKLTWIDHHKSAIDAFNAFDHSSDNNITTVLEIGRGACELTWEYIFPTVPVPSTIKWLGKYDTWREYGTQSWDNHIMPFQYGMRQLCVNIETFPRYILLDGFLPMINEILEKGRNIIKYQKSIDNKICNTYAFERKFKGLNAICLNLPFIDSTTMNSVYDSKKHDIMLGFSFTGKHWSCSLRSDNDVDCSVIAKSLGGGGHANAAGFEVKTFEDIFN